MKNLMYAGILDAHANEFIQSGIVVLLVEDNAADAFLVREAIREQGLPFELHVVSDGREGAQIF